MYLRSFSYFRAIAIILVILSHTLLISHWVLDTFWEKSLRTFIAGATALFVFISGFLFHHKFYEGFNYRRFIKGKVKNVLIPYFLLSTPYVVYFLVTHKARSLVLFVPNHAEGIFEMYIWPAIRYYLNGGTSIAFWYIPFILIVFALSPLMLKYVKLKSAWQVGLLILLSGVSMRMHRPLANMQEFQSVVYYLPIYLLGITCSINKETIYYWFRGGREFILLVAALILIYVQVHFFNHVGNYHKEPFGFTTLDLMYPQKVLLCFFFMVFLNRFEAYDWRWLNQLANASFALYFIHSFLFQLIEFNLQGKIFNFLGGINWLLISILLITGSYLVAILVRKLTPRYSKQLIGW